MKKVASPVGCGVVDTINMMWAVSNDGDPYFGEFIEDPIWTPEFGIIRSAIDGHGVFFLDYPTSTGSEPTKLSYNWWSGFTESPNLDFGPQTKDNWRDFGSGGTGWPWGDNNRYFVMSNGEIDYDMVYTASIRNDDPIWVQPPSEIAVMASSLGLPTAPPNMLSIGPYDLDPGESFTIPFAFVCGLGIHTDPANNTEHLPYSPRLFYENLDFTDLIENATWARWVYDNPGVDTDGDLYAGEFIECEGDTIYYTGDGVPDWRGAMPPPAPKLWLEPIANGLRIRFNGARTETSPDMLTGNVDFEGYNIYGGLDERRTSMALIASYDIENWDKYVFSGDFKNIQFMCVDTPFTVGELRCLYGSGDDPCLDSTFDPRDYTTSNLYVHEEFDDSIFYFLEHGYNSWELGVTTPIRKVYPDEPYPVSLNTDSVPAAALTEDGYLKYFEYELTIENMVPTVQYWVSVTAFDYGAPSMGIYGLESSVNENATGAYPLGPSDVTSPGKIYVYPNPYRKDAGYRDLGYEGRLEEDRPDHRVRAIHFANLPPKCTISIYSLDGDLVRRLDHDMDPSDPNSTHDSWNLITRNTQMVVSGLYYWVVEAPDGSVQMGKFVVIM